MISVKTCILVLGLSFVLSGCGNSPEAIAEEVCRCEQVAGDDAEAIQKCRDSAKEALKAFEDDAEAIDRGIQAYHNSGCE